MVYTRVSSWPELKTFWNRSSNTSWYWDEKNPIVRCQKFVTKDKCLSEKPMNWSSWDRQFHFGIFLPSWSLGSRTKYWQSNMCECNKSLWWALVLVNNSKEVRAEVWFRIWFCIQDWQQRQVIYSLLTPMKRNMNHEGSSHENNYFNGTLSHGVLMICTYTREALRLILEFPIITEHIRSESSIVPVHPKFWIIL